MSDEKKPEISYWHLWADQDGMSHQKECKMTQFQKESMGGDADEQWNSQKTKQKTTTMFSVLPVGWVGGWHENPKPQWIVPLSGRWSVEAMDGTKQEFGAGDVSFGGDQGCTKTDGRVGHRSTTVGDEPAVLMLVQFEDMDTPSSPCAFK